MSYILRLDAFFISINILIFCFNPHKIFLQLLFSKSFLSTLLVLTFKSGVHFKFLKYESHFQKKFDFY